MDTFLLHSVFTKVKKIYIQILKKEIVIGKAEPVLIWKNHNYSQCAPNQERINYLTERKVLPLTIPPWSNLYNVHQSCIIFHMQLRNVAQVIKPQKHI